MLIRRARRQTRGRPEHPVGAAERWLLTIIEKVTPFFRPSWTRYGAWVAHATLFVGLQDDGVAAGHWAKLPHAVGPLRQGRGPLGLGRLPARGACEWDEHPRQDEPGSCEDEADRIRSHGRDGAD